MSIDELGLEAGRELTRASQSLERHSLETITKNRRTRAGIGTAFVLATAALLVVTISVVSPSDGDAVSGTTSPPPPTTTLSPGTTVPRTPPDGTVFVPPAVERDGMTEVTLTLLDGSVITVNYSSELDLTSGGFTTQLASWHGEDLNDGRTVEAHFGAIEDFVEVRSEWLGGRQELFDITQDDPVSASASGRVERWAFEDLAYLLFEFDGWTVSVWDGVPGSPNPVMTADEQRLWASAIGGVTDADGFLVLSAEPGLTLVPAWDEGGPSGPDGRIDGASGGLGVFLNDCDRMTRLDEESYEPPVFAWCDEETNTLFFAFGESAAVNQLVHETLEVRRLYVPTVGWVHASGDEEFIELMREELEIRRP